MKTLSKKNELMAVHCSGTLAARKRFEAMLG